MSIAEREDEALQEIEKRFDPENFTDSYPEKLLAAIWLCDYVRLRKVLKYGLFAVSVLFNLIAGIVVLSKKFRS